MGEAWQQECEAAGHIVSTVRKRRKMARALSLLPPSSLLPSLVFDVGEAILLQNIVKKNCGVNGITEGLKSGM